MNNLKSIVEFLRKEDQEFFADHLEGWIVEISHLREKIANLESVKQHMESCRALLKVPEDEVLYVAIEELKKEIQEKDDTITRMTIQFLNLRKSQPAGEDGSTPQSAVDQSVIEKANKILEEG